jgi:O-antigen ligase
MMATAPNIAPPIVSSVPFGRRRRRRRGRVSSGGRSAFEIWLWAVCLFAITSPFALILTGVDPTMNTVHDPATMRQADNSQLPLYGIRALVMMLAVMVLLSQWRTLGSALRRTAPIRLFLGWMILSIWWSDSVDSTVHGVMALLPVVAICLLLAIRMRPNDLARAMVYAGAIAALASIVWVLAMPAYGVHQVNDARQAVHAGAWRGVYMHKNHLGQAMAVYLAGTILAGPAVLRSRMLKWALVAIQIALIVMSRSASAIAIAPAAILIVWVLVAMSRLERVVASFYVIALSAAGAMAVQAVLLALGRDATLSGRTTIWSLAGDSIAERPLTGYGFVSQTYGQFTYELFHVVGVLDPHNGYLDLVLGLGFIGLILFLQPVAMVWLGARRMYLAGGRHRQGALVLAAQTAAWLVANLTESNIRPLASVATIGVSAMCLMIFSIPHYRRSRRRGGVVSAVYGVGAGEVLDYSNTGRRRRRRFWPFR